MLDYLDSTQLIKYERVSMTFQSICRGHQRTQKVLHINMSRRPIPSYADAFCHDSSHAINGPIFIHPHHVHLIPSIISKFLNIIALYIFNENLNKIEFKNIKLISQNLEHIHLQGSVDPAKLQHLFLLINGSKIKHLILRTRNGSELDEEEDIIKIIKRCPRLEMLYTFDLRYNVLKSSPKLTDYRCCNMNLNDLKDFTEEKGHQLIKFSTLEQKMDIKFNGMMSLIGKMKNLKQLSSLSFLSNFYNVQHFPHRTELEFESPTQLMQGNYKIKRLVILDSLNIDSITSFPTDKIPFIESVRFARTNFYHHISIDKTVDLLYKLKGLRFVNFESNHDLGKILINELLKRDTCFECVIFDLENLYSNHGPEHEIIELLHSLARKHSKTRFTCKIADKYKPSNYSSPHENLIFRDFNHIYFN